MIAKTIKSKDRRFFGKLVFEFDEYEFSEDWRVDQIYLCPIDDIYKVKMVRKIDNFVLVTPISLISPEFMQP